MNVKGCTCALSQPALQADNQPSDMELQDANARPSWISSACVLHLRTHCDASSRCSALRYCHRASAHLHSSPVLCLTQLGSRAASQSSCMSPLGILAGSVLLSSFSSLQHHTTSCSFQTAQGPNALSNVGTSPQPPRKQQSKYHYSLFAFKELT